MNLIEIEAKTKPIVYKSKLEKTKGNIFYFHGGGFIFGINNDLPDYHIDMITKSGYNILSFNYPLAPESDFSNIIKYTINLINLYSKSLNIPYFLWGRSAGAYLCMLSASKGLDIKPRGIISYYGYGLLVPDWYNTPSEYYLKYPLVKYSLVKDFIGEEIRFSAPINPRFLFYLYTRQTGNWINFLSNESEECFLDNYSLRNTNFKIFPPLLLTHNTSDKDVPYEESLALNHLIKDSKLITVTTKDHDFDKNTDNLITVKLIQETIQFLDQHL